MEKYNSNAMCPKCGCTGISNTFHAKGSLVNRGGNWVETECDGVQFVTPYQSMSEYDYIERVCFNCGYTWEEEPIDSK